MFLERRATVYYSARAAIAAHECVCLCVCMCVCRIVNKHFSWSGDGLWRAALISNIIYLLVPCVGHTHTHSHSDSLFHHAPTINLIPSSFSPPLPLSFLEIDGVFCHPMLCFMQYSSKEKSSSHTQWIFINSVRRWLVNEGLRAWHTCSYDHTHQQPHYPSFRRGLCFVPLESDSDLWIRAVTLHPDTHNNTKQGYWPKHGYKERLLLPQQSHTDSSARRGSGSTPHQCSPMDEFSWPDKWMHWSLSATCSDEFHEYEYLCFLT